MLDNQPLQLVRQQESNITRVDEIIISIVICAYMHEKYINQLLDSIVCRYPERIELIIIDDGSPDGTLRKINEYDYNINMCTRIFTKPNRGLVDSLRSGLRLARGCFVAFIASDDIYAPRCIDQLIDILSTNTNKFDAAVFQAEYFGERINSLVYGDAMASFFSLDASGRVESICTEYPKPMLLQSALFNTEFLRKLDPWRDNLLLDDWPTFIRLFLAELNQGASIRYFPQITICRYRIHASGIHNDLIRQFRATMEIANRVVPPRYRRKCIANTQFDVGLIYLVEGLYLTGLYRCLSGLFTMPAPSILWRVGKRGFRFLRKKVLRGLGN